MKGVEALIEGRVIANFTLGKSKGCVTYVIIEDAQCLVLQVAPRKLVVIGKLAANQQIECLGLSEALPRSRFGGGSLTDDLQRAVDRLRHINFEGMFVLSVFIGEPHNFVQTHSKPLWLEDMDFGDWLDKITAGSDILLLSE